MSDLSHDEIQELLGAYALDAVDDRERAVIESHLDTCESCRLELEDHRGLAENAEATRGANVPVGERRSQWSVQEDRCRPRATTHSPEFARRHDAHAHSARRSFAQGEIRFNELQAGMERVELLERAQLATTDPTAIVTTLHTPYLFSGVHHLEHVGV